MTHKPIKYYKKEAVFMNTKGFNINFAELTNLSRFKKLSDEDSKQHSGLNDLHT